MLIEAVSKVIHPVDVAPGERLGQSDLVNVGMREGQVKRRSLVVTTENLNEGEEAGMRRPIKAGIPAKY